MKGSNVFNITSLICSLVFQLIQIDEPFMVNQRRHTHTHTRAHTHTHTHAHIHQKVNSSVCLKVHQAGAGQHCYHYKQVKYFKARNLCVRNFCNFENPRDLRNLFSQTYENENFHKNLFLRDEFSTHF